MVGPQRELEETLHRMELENTRLDMALQHEKDKSTQLNRECSEARQVCIPDVTSCLTSTRVPALSVKRFAQVQYNYNTAAIQELFSCIQLYCICADPCTTTLQYKFSTSCRKPAGY